jgi:G:T-mismatch repair DNA endonuclease (very short patch repair protein)
MPKKLTYRQVVQKFNNAHGNKYDYSKFVYINTYTKSEIICFAHGPFWQTPKKHASGQGCPFCSKTKKLTKQEFKQKAKKVHNNFYDYSFVKYKNNFTNVEIICPLHGSFKQTPGNHTIRKQGCPSCAGVKKTTIKDFKQKAEKKHGKKYDYLFTKEIKNNRMTIDIICLKHGKFKQSITNHLNGAGCPTCAKNVKLTQDEFLTLCREIYKNKYDYTFSKYKNSKTKIKIICKKHGSFWKTPSEHLKLKRGCSICSKRTKISKKQYELYEKIKNKQQNAILEYKIKTKSGKLIFADIFIPEKNMIIEYFGDYWHCNPRKYKPNYFHPHKKLYAKNIWSEDKKRKSKLEELGYKVIVVWENKN